MKVDYSVVDN